MTYVGRFAPSPTGPLHFGSLLAAIGSYLDARAAGGRWLLRIEDVDGARCSHQAEDDIIATLQRFGLEWDGPIIYQRERTSAYQATLKHLQETGAVFACACSRREIADSALARDGSRLYPGTCRNGLPPGRSGRAWRLRVCGAIDFDDRVQGPQRENLETEVGDFVLLRADGQFAYQLAVVVDDALEGVTDVVRGADLLDSTARQLFLQRRLGLPAPRYAHLPVALDRAGDKLSKQTLARAVDATEVEACWLAVLRFLGQNPPDGLNGASMAEIRAWAVANWSLSRVPARRAIRTPAAFLANE